MARSHNGENALETQTSEEEVLGKSEKRKTTQRPRRLGFSTPAATDGLDHRIVRVRALKRSRPRSTRSESSGVHDAAGNEIRPGPRRFLDGRNVAVRDV